MFISVLVYVNRDSDSITIYLSEKKNQVLKANTIFINFIVMIQLRSKEVEGFYNGIKNEVIGWIIKLE